MTKLPDTFTTIAIRRRGADDVDVADGNKLPCLRWEPVANALMSIRDAWLMHDKHAIVMASSHFPDHIHLVIKAPSP
jgi:hypothetical protein